MCADTETRFDTHKSTAIKKAIYQRLVNSLRAK